MMSDKKPLIILTGPTAVGKTELSVMLAKEMNAEIISADSIQVYKYMDIGSAKITKEEMQGIKHYLVDELNPSEEFSIYKFKEMTLKYMDEIYSKGKIPIIAGGTGFYIQSVLYDINFSETDDEHIYRKELEAIAKEKGPEYLHNKLKEIDAVTAQKVHSNNVKRVIRALEYYNDTGKLLSEHNEEQQKHDSPYNFKYFVLNDDRQLLYDRINKRVDKMFELGLVKEVKNLLDMGYGRNLVSMQGIGYKETVAYILGEMNLEDTIELIKKNTRHFAKRQLTWFRREKEVTWIDYREYGNNKKVMSTKMTEMCRNAGICTDRKG
ncbi:MAG: tRNA (adenosine(37)-N6)-dimethylallyltransferase MiaA [Lachnospiraceae bacterium]|nr:tRNA (adenosine(37)-N6)-dimethylallyltransferase MiaA [Lachnospiraceae bacterium]